MNDEGLQTQICERRGPSIRRRQIELVAGTLVVLVTLLALAPADVRAQFGFGDAAILLRILTQNIQINDKLGTNNALTKGYWDWHRDDLAAGYRRALPLIDKRLTRIFRDREIGYVERELGRIESIVREGRVDPTNRDHYEGCFGKIPDTPDALSELAVDANTVYLMTKAGQIHKKIQEYKDEIERLAAEQQTSPYRAEQIQKQQDLLGQKIAACQAQVSAIDATNQAYQTAMANKFVKDDKAAQLANAEEMRRWFRSAKPPWMTDGQQQSAPPY